MNGVVKTIIVNKKSLKNASDNQTETRNYDRTGRMIRKIASYDTRQPLQKSYEIKQYDAQGKLILTAETEGDKIADLDTYGEAAPVYTDTRTEDSI